MFKLLILLCCFVALVDVNAENSTESDEENNNNDYEKNRTNGKTFLFQARKNDNGDDNEPMYKIFDNYRQKAHYYNAPPQEFIGSDEQSTRPTMFDSLNKRRRHYTSLDIYTNVYKAHLLDPEWDFNLNNEQVDVPAITNYMYAMISDNPESLNISSIRFVFETHGSEDNILEFNLDALKNKTDEYILDAELLIYRFSEFYHADDNDGTHLTDEVIRLYQVLHFNDTEENSKRNPDLHKLLNVIYLSSQNAGWQVFKVRNIVQNWLDSEPNLGFLLTATDSWGKPIYLNLGRKFHGKFQPILIISLAKFEQRTVQIPQLTKPNKKQVEEYVNQRANNKLPMTRTPCGRQIWYVNFQEIGWNSFILAPPGFMAYQCRDSCAHPEMSHTTNHAIFKHIFNNFHLKKPCCVPDTYKPLPVMFLDRNKNVVIKIYDDMIVDSCACR